MSEQSVGQGRTMVYHAPYPVGEGSTSGSGIRPVRMLDAFRGLGYEVVEVTGHGKERAAAVRDLGRRLENGLRVDLAYGESSTMPTVLTEPHHLPTHPVVDVRLARLLRRHGVPTSVFYRDIYWRYPEYTERVHPVVAAGTRTLYHAELRAYRRLLDRVYVPSREFAVHVPHLRPEQMAPLPPGGALRDVPRTEGPFTLLYVGNVTSYYRMHELLRAVDATPGVHLLLCTPKDSWEAARGEYADWLGDRVEVVHERGDGLLPLFGRADACSIVVEPSEYRDFAAPIKLYEYIGHGKPVLAATGTLAGRTIETGGLGWAVDYDADALADRLAALRDDAGEVEAVAAHVREARHEHTWAARARQVAADLAALDRRA
ncbi:glycosyltransferase [Georgenia sp. Z1344]|uniref:glycosyltransferase n=1 Tax=Georgenia sp. Z1344 TaxID=3416706 RepID=UPI003CF38658